MYHSSWRAALAEYAGLGIKEAKKEIIFTRYGNVPRRDIPWLRLLGEQIHWAAQEIQDLPRYASLKDKYADRRNPIYGRLASILVSPENDVLGQTIAAMAKIDSDVPVNTKRNLPKPNKLS